MFSTEAKSRVLRIEQLFRTLTCLQVKHVMFENSSVLISKGNLTLKSTKQLQQLSKTMLLGITRSRVSNVNDCVCEFMAERGA